MFFLSEDVSVSCVGGTLIYNSFNLKNAKYEDFYNRIEVNV